MVTGATDGIGLGGWLPYSRTVGYAKRLAARGVNVVLVSRSQDKLEKCANEIKDTYHVVIRDHSHGQVDVRTVAIDMSQDTTKLKEALEPIFRSVPIGILVV